MTTITKWFYIDKLLLFELILNSHMTEWTKWPVQNVSRLADQIHTNSLIQEKCGPKVRNHYLPQHTLAIL